MESSNVNTELADRMRQVCEYYGISMSKMSKDMGRQRSYLLGLRATLDCGLARYVHEHYPEISMAWLSTGEGEMVTSDASGAQPLIYKLFSEEREENKRLRAEIDRLKDLIEREFLRDLNR